MFSIVTKSVNKPLSKFYPKELVTIGDHLRTKRLDLKLRQKDLESHLGVCQATILLWEKNTVEPQAASIAKVNDFLGYCLLSETPIEHFGHQLRLLRINTLGKTIFELATDIGIDEGTLSEIETINIIRYTSVLNSIKGFLKRVGWNLVNNSNLKFIPTRSKCLVTPRYNSVIGEPKTLGVHIALKRKQLKLTQEQAMAQIGVISISAFRSWEKYGKEPQIKYYPKIMEFIGYCPIQYPKNKGHQLKLFREHLGFSCRKVDQQLNLSKGCVYRLESSSDIADTALKLKVERFYMK